MRRHRARFDAPVNFTTNTRMQSIFWPGKIKTVTLLLSPDRTTAMSQAGSPARLEATAHPPSRGSQ